MRDEDSKSGEMWVRAYKEHIKQQKSSLVSLFPGDIAPDPNAITKWANMIEFMQSILVAIEIPDFTCLSHSPVILNSPNLSPSPQNVYFRSVYYSTYGPLVAFDPVQNVNTVEPLQMHILRKCCLSVFLIQSSH